MPDYDATMATQWLYASCAEVLRIGVDVGGPNLYINNDAGYDYGRGAYQAASTRSEEIHAAHAKSKDLFIRTLGADAFNTLLWGGSIPVKGSKGGNYILQCKYSHCVVDIDRGISMCAIVPGVPLWDHLLGIKLMIENDETHFRKVAHSEYATDCDYVIPPGLYL